MSDHAIQFEHADPPKFNGGLYRFSWGFLVSGGVLIQQSLYKYAFGAI
ncbi:hypothetical protein SAMN04244547_03605 [Azotobacter vinelandii]|nr:hypothetical protein SAMN04244547_03605 [Azotobacter vinelandii]